MTKRSALIALMTSMVAPAVGQVHVWEKQELTFTAAGSYANPYTQVTVWVDLTGPNFKKRVYGFWDGDRTFRVRVVASDPGNWTWQSGSNPPDAGLAGKTGAFEAIPWTEAEKQQNQLRRGFLRSTANHHALETADGTPFLILGDTWWSLGSNRFPWNDDDRERPMGPTAGFKDYVRYRKAQGYNLVGMIAAFPNWVTDGKPWHVSMPDGTTVRSAWLEFGTGSAKNEDNEGGRSFLFPGKVPGYEDMFPDVDRINPKYFHYIDRKIDYLNQQGFVVFIEAARRDVSECWKKFYSWPDSYARYIEYIFARYGANNTLLSPIHFDTPSASVPTSQYQTAIQLALDKYGPPPFGNLLTGNAAPSTLLNWGDHSWVTLHQIGNAREHVYYWYLTQIFRSADPQPALDGEPYYSGYKDARDRPGAGYKYGAPGGTEKDDQYVRSAIYGTFLSGGFAGYIYGAEGIWGADIEPQAPVHMWEAFQWNSANEVQRLRTFAFSNGTRYQDLVPDADMVTPSQTQITHGYEGWAYCARTPEKDLVLLYFEKGCARSEIRTVQPVSIYAAQCFDPRSGKWSNVGDGWLRSNVSGVIRLPDFPGDADWGLRLVYAGPADQPTSTR